MHPFIFELQFFILRPQPEHVLVQLVELGNFCRDSLLIALEINLNSLIASDLASELLLHLALAALSFLLDLGELTLVTAHFLDEIVSLCFAFSVLVRRGLQLFATSL